MPDPFRWPPKNSTEQDAPPAATGVPASPTPRQPPEPGAVRRPSVWRSLEETFLGTRSELLGSGMPWSPVPIDACCPRCGRVVGLGEVSPDDARCTGCRTERLRWDRLLHLGLYEGELRRAIVETKYGPWRAQGGRLGTLLGERLRDAVLGAGIDPSNAVLVPAPMPFDRRFRRGIDHTLVMARGVSRRLGAPVIPLLRKHRGPTQASVPASRRVQNIRGRIVASRRLPPGIDLLILIDDVATTGATLDACCRALEGGGTGALGPVWVDRPRIWCGVAALAPEPGRRSPPA